MRARRPSRTASCWRCMRAQRALALAKRTLCIAKARQGWAAALPADWESSVAAGVIFTAILHVLTAAQGGCLMQRGCTASSCAVGSIFTVHYQQLLYHDLFAGQLDKGVIRVAYYCLVAGTVEA